MVVEHTGVAKTLMYSQAENFTWAFLPCSVKCATNVTSHELVTTTNRCQNPDKSLDNLERSIVKLRNSSTGILVP